MDSLSPKTARLYEMIGTWMIRVSVVFLLVLFGPAAFQELRYYGLTVRQSMSLDQTHESAPTVLEAVEKAEAPADRDFGIVIPKIGANAKVIPDVDWQDSRIYQRALTDGVAHARGSALPDGGGNVFLFAHAGANPLEAWRYNAVFYLLDKLAAGDRIELWYAGSLRPYQVVERRVVRADEVDFIAGKPGVRQLTLMTCWPAGTTWKRLIVIAEPLVVETPIVTRTPTEVF